MDLGEAPDRRAFLRLGIGAGLTAGGVAALSGSAFARGRADERQGREIPQRAIGMHLYTMRSLMRQDAGATLDALAEIGYRRVGVSGKYGYSPRQFRDLLDRAGLEAVITHRNLSDIRSHAIHQTVDDAHTLGVNQVVVRYLPVPRTIQAYRQAAELFNEAGAVLRRNGLGRLLFHNHAGNFAMVDGVRLYDILLEQTDPQLVGFEFDTYWAAKAGVNIPHMWARNPRRFPVLHVKDMAQDGSITNVGAGILNFAKIFDHSRRAGVNQWLVEHDNPSDPLATARISYAYLSNLTF